MGTEILIGLALAFIVLGPERMHSMLGHLGKAKAQFDNASQALRDQFAGQHEAGTGTRMPLGTLPSQAMRLPEKADQ